MLNSYPIFKKEVGSYFLSPVAYVVITIFLVLSGYFFYSSVAYYSLISMQAIQNPYMVSGLNLTEDLISPVFANIGIIAMLIIPMLTMRLFSEEKKSGTIELLFTYPLKDIDILLGKFFAATVVYLTPIAVTLLYIVFIRNLTDLPLGPVFAGYLGLILMGTAFIALGILVSSTTENQIVAAIITFGLLLLLWVIGWASSFTGPLVGKILTEISLVKHFQNFSKGVIDISDVIFYLSFTFYSLFLTCRVLESKRWRG
jgi:ABC-2 type transport system permease protein